MAPWCVSDAHSKEGGDAHEGRDGFFRPRGKYVLRTFKLRLVNHVICKHSLKIGGCCVQRIPPWTGHVAGIRSLAEFAGSGS